MNKVEQKQWEGKNVTTSKHNAQSSSGNAMLMKFDGGAREHIEPVLRPRQRKAREARMNLEELGTLDSSPRPKRRREETCFRGHRHIDPRIARQTSPRERQSDSYSSRSGTARLHAIARQHRTTPTTHTGPTFRACEADSRSSPSWAANRTGGFSPIMRDRVVPGRDLTRLFVLRRCVQPSPILVLHHASGRPSVRRVGVREGKIARPVCHCLALLRTRDNARSVRRA